MEGGMKGVLVPKLIGFASALSDSFGELPICSPE
jgi:hypothetical protein